jgi:hypothetical protein
VCVQGSWTCVQGTPSQPQGIHDQGAACGPEVSSNPTDNSEGAQVDEKLAFHLGKIIPFEIDLEL